MYGKKGKGEATGINQVTPEVENYQI